MEGGCARKANKKEVKFKGGGEMDKRKMEREKKKHEQKET